MGEIANYLADAYDEARKRTAIADAQLDEEGRTIKSDETEELKNDDGVVMVESRVANLPGEEKVEEPANLPKKSKKKSIDVFHTPYQPHSYADSQYFQIDK